MAGDTVEQVKDRLSIIDVVSPYVKLTKTGRSLKGLCPFHKEKTPSFNVSVDRGTFHCFGCGVGGDIFTFIEKVEGVDFKGALTILAEKAGVEIVHDPSARERTSRAERLREALTRAVEFYVSKLPNDSAAYLYALQRGLSSKTIQTWELGYAPDTWRALLEHLSAKEFKIEELLAAGLIKEADGTKGTYYDRFRNRLMFPIRDAAGRTIAFTGRALDQNDLAKYLNSPETDLYHKSEVLFGMDKAKDAIRSRGFTLLVEGQMDLLHAHQAGFENTLALSGTALTPRHIALIKRYSENLMLALDADPAGLVATAKSANLALREGMKVKAVRLPEGKDPADLIVGDSKDFAKRVAEGKPIVEFFLGVLSERERDPHRLVLSAERTVLPLIRAIRSPMEREHFISSAARALGLSPEAVRASVARLPDVPPEMPKVEVPPVSPVVKALPSEKRKILLQGAVNVYPDTGLAKRIQEEYARIVGAPLEDTPILESALFEAEQLFGESPSLNAADELLRAFEEAVIREAYQEEIQRLRRAEVSGDSQGVVKAQEAVARLSVRLSALSS